MEEEFDVILKKEKKRKIKFQILAIIQIIITALYAILFFQVMSSASENHPSGITMEESGVYAFNAQFEAYVGRQSGSSVNILIRKVVNNNNSDNFNRKVSISYTADDGSYVDGEITSDYKKVSSNKYYKVKTECNKEGWLYKIIVTDYE